MRSRSKRRKLEINPKKEKWFMEINPHYRWNHPHRVIVDMQNRMDQRCKCLYRCTRRTELPPNYRVTMDHETESTKKHTNIELIVDRSTNRTSMQPQSIDFWLFLSSQLTLRSELNHAGTDYKFSIKQQNYLKKLHKTHLQKIEQIQHSSKKLKKT